VIEKEKKATLLLVHNNERMQDKENMWHLDNKVGNHMCGDKDKFMKLDEAINYAIYLLNRCHTKSMNDMTPQEA